MNIPGRFSAATLTLEQANALKVVYEYGFELAPGPVFVGTVDLPETFVEV